MEPDDPRPTTGHHNDPEHQNEDTNTHKTHPQAGPSPARKIRVKAVHRRDTFRAHPATVEAVQTSPVEIITGATISKVVGADSVELVEIALGDEVRTVPCQRIIAGWGSPRTSGHC